MDETERLLRQALRIKMLQKASQYIDSGVFEQAFALIDSAARLHDFGFPPPGLDSGSAAEVKP